MVDQAEHRIEVGGDRASEVPQALAQHGEIVVVAEDVAEAVGVLGLAAHDARRGGRQHPKVVPQVLGAFAPLVEVLDGGIGMRSIERGAAAPVAAIQAGLDRSPAAVSQMPFVDAAPDGLELVGHLARHAGVEQAGPRGIALGYELLANRGEGLHRDLAGKAVGKVVERLDHDLSVTGGRHLAAGMPERVVLAPAVARCERAAGQAQQRALLFERLARGMHGLDRVGAHAVGQFVDRAVELLAGAAAQAGPNALAAVKSVRQGDPPRIASLLVALPNGVRG